MTEKGVSCNLYPSRLPTLAIRLRDPLLSLGVVRYLERLRIPRSPLPSAANADSSEPNRLGQWPGVVEARS